MKPVLAPAAIASPDAALERLFSAEAPRLKGLARRLLGDAAEADDLVQAALADAWARRTQLAALEAGPAWLRQAVVHRALSAMRRRRLWSAIGKLLLLEPEPTSEGPELALERGRHLARLRAELERLPAQQAAAFTLRYLEGVELDAVADALGCARGTARIHVQRAVRRLKARGALEELP